MKTLVSLCSLVLLSLTLLVTSAGAQVVERLSLDSLKTSCLKCSARVCGERVYREALFDFFEYGSVEEAAAVRGIAPREEARRLKRGATVFVQCVNQRIR